MSGFDQIMEGLEEARAFVRGEDTGATVHVVDVPDVAALRHALGLSQVAFARTFDVSVGTLRGWEQGRRVPHGPARALLRVIAREPEAVRRALELDAGNPANTHQQDSSELQSQGSR